MYIIHSYIQKFQKNLNLEREVARDRHKIKKTNSYQNSYHSPPKGVSKGVSEVSGNWSDFLNLKILV